MILFHFAKKMSFRLRVSQVIHPVSITRHHYMSFPTLHANLSIKKLKMIFLNLRAIVRRETEPVKYIYTRKLIESKKFFVQIVKNMFLISFVGFD